MWTHRFLGAAPAWLIPSRYQLTVAPRAPSARAWTLAVGTLALASVAWSAALASPTSVIRGRRLAEQNCAACHSLSGAAPSPMPDAPRFADLERLSAGRGLDAIFAEGLREGHPPMPTFLANGEATADILDFIRSVQVRAPAQKPASTRPF